MSTRKRRLSALRGWQTRRKRKAARSLERARTAALRLSVGETLAWFDGRPEFVVVRIDHKAGTVTLNCADGS